MELKNLHSFLILAEELHFGRAAGRLGIAQPALSQQIKQLELQLGVELFRRSTRSVVLTPAAEALVVQARRVLAAADQAVTVARAATRGDRPVLTVGFLGQGAAEDTTPLLTEFRRRRPEVVVRLRALGFADHLTQLREGGVDLSLIRPPYGADEMAGLATVSLAEEPRVVVLPAGHALAARAAVVFADIAEEPFIRGPDAVSPVWQAFWRVDERRGGRPATLSEESAGSIEEMLAVVAAGRAVAITHASLGRFYVRPTVRFVPVIDISPSTLALAWCADDPSPTVHDFVAAARNVTFALDEFDEFR
jgi:DNA-binding transcriptional LysR family regulator